MKKAILLVLLVLLAGISIQAQEGKRPENLRKPGPRMKMEGDMKREFHEMGMKKRRLEFENYISELEFEKEMRELELEKTRASIEKDKSCNSGYDKWKRGRCKGRMIGHAIFCFMFMAVMLVIHILLTVWVFMDTRKRGTGGLFIVITLLTGFMGAFLYALVRIGDKKK